MLIMRIVHTLTLHVHPHTTILLNSYSHRMPHPTYSQWQKGFLPKKNAIMLGKTLAEVEVEQDMDRDEDADINDKLMKSSALRKSGANKAMQQQAASSQA